MSALETDLNPNTYVGLSFPLRRDKFNDFAMTKNSLQQAHHNLKNLLLTSPGERAMQPEFGSNMRAICFEQVDKNLPVTIEKEVRNEVITLCAKFPIYNHLVNYIHKMLLVSYLKINYQMLRV